MFFWGCDAEKCSKKTRSRMHLLRRTQRRLRPRFSSDIPKQPKSRRFRAFCGLHRLPPNAGRVTGGRHAGSKELSTHGRRSAALPAYSVLTPYTPACCRTGCFKNTPNLPTFRAGQGEYCSAAVCCRCAPPPARARTNEGAIEDSRLSGVCGFPREEKGKPKEAKKKSVVLLSAGEASKHNTESPLINNNSKRRIKKGELHPTVPRSAGATATAANRPATSWHLARQLGGGEGLPDAIGLLERGSWSTVCAGRAGRGAIDQREAPQAGVCLYWFCCILF